MAVDTEKGNTPIADAFAQDRAVMADAMALIRKLERDRAELVAIAIALGNGEEWAAVSYPLDKLELP